MRHVSLVWLFLMLAGCGSITLADETPDADATTAALPMQGAGAGASKGAPAPAAPAPAPAPADPAGCDKMCQSGNGDGADKHGDHACEKPPCPSGNSG